jgi:sugar/nucleoside kinase (ribokinase family)
MLDVLCVGDSVVDIFLKVPEKSPHFDLDKEKNQLLITLGEKIIIEKYIMEVGGNAANTAVGISRLGLNTGLCAEIGKDEFSQKILDRLKEENVNTDFLLQKATQKTSFSVILSYNGERTIFTEHVERDHDFNFNDLKTKFIYLTSLGKNWERAYEKILEYVEKNTDVKLAFNPGTLQIEKKDKLVMNIIEKTDYLFLNKEEAEVLLYGEKLDIKLADEKSFIKKLLFGLKSLGAKNIIITDSNNGSYIQDSSNKTFCLGILEEKIVEKTGAGDAYTSGFLAGIITGKSVEHAMIWGTINASSVILQIGAEEGLLTKQALEEKIKEFNNFYPTKL